MGLHFLLLASTIAIHSIQAPSAQILESQRKQELVTRIQDRIDDWIKTAGDAKGDWQGDRARLEMQLATARLELAAVLLLEARSKTIDDRKVAVLESLKLVQDADRTLDRVNIERLDDFDRRAYRGLTAMRHRVTSLQVHSLLGMVNAEVLQTAPTVPSNPNMPLTPEPKSPEFVIPRPCATIHSTQPSKSRYKFYGSGRCRRH